MADDLAALKVKIGIRPNGHAAYPDFNSLASVSSSGMDWSKYIDHHGRGWQYATIGHRQVGDDSPIGEQWGLLLVPEEFATQATSAFPDECSRITAAEAAAFYDAKVADRFEEEEVDSEVLAAIKQKQDLGIRLTRQDKRAIDPRDSARGVRQNRRKRFATWKADQDFNVIDPA